MAEEVSIGLQVSHVIDGNYGESVFMALKDRAETQSSNPAEALIATFVVMIASAFRPQIVTNLTATQYLFHGSTSHSPILVSGTRR